MLGIIFLGESFGDWQQSFNCLMLSCCPLAYSWVVFFFNLTGNCGVRVPLLLNGGWWRRRMPGQRPWCRWSATSSDSAIVTSIMCLSISAQERYDFLSQSSFDSTCFWRNDTYLWVVDISTTWLEVNYDNCSVCMHLENATLCLFSCWATHREPISFMFASSFSQWCSKDPLHVFESCCFLLWVLLTKCLREAWNEWIQFTLG